MAYMVVATILLIMVIVWLLLHLLGRLPVTVVKLGLLDLRIERSGYIIQYGRHFTGQLKLNPAEWVIWRFERTPGSTTVASLFLEVCLT